jgi:cell wall assembly regulator SMI1
VLASLWNELTSWLAVNAPRTYESLRPPGAPARLIAAERQLGFALGAELTEWWQLHDGADYGLVPGYELNGVDAMLASHRIELEVNLEFEVENMARRNLGMADDEAGRPARYFPSEFVPIGDDGAGNSLVVDCSPGPAYGCVRDHDHEARGVIAPPYFASLADLLAQLVTSLRTGRPVEKHTDVGTFLKTPTVSDGKLWCGARYR